jgi:hypothetical protein
MSTFYKKAALICAAAAAGAVLCAMPISVERSAISGIVLSIDQAQARVGRPGTPVSVAGHHRRERRSAFAAKWMFSRETSACALRRGGAGRPQPAD